MRFHRHICAALGLLMLLVASFGAAAPGFSQTTQTPATGEMQGPVQPIDYGAWERFASQVENSLDSSSLTDQQLAELRTQVVAWRARFTQAQGTNANRIRALRDQIDALGPAPAEGETEAEDVAARRTELNATLAELQAPGIAATEAFSRADALVRTIDELTRERQAAELARMTPSPLLPSSWAAAWGDLGSYLGNARSELVEGAAHTADNNREELPFAALLFLGAVLLLTRGRHYLNMLPASLSSRAGESARAVVAFIVSLGQIVIPILAALMLVYAVGMFGLFGPLTAPVLMAFPLAALTLSGGMWLARNLFSEKAIVYDTLNLPQHKRRPARFAASMLSLFTALHILLGDTLLPLSGWAWDSAANGTPEPRSFGEAAAGVLHLAIMLPAAWFLFRLSNTLRRLKKFDGTDAPPFRARILTVVGNLLRVVAVGGPLLLAVGLVNLSNAIFWSSVISLALIALLVLLQDFVADFYGMLRRGEEGARDGLAPLSIGLLLILASMPVFALIWGVTTTELGEWRERLMAGTAIGGIRLSPGAIMTFLVVFFVGFLATRWAQSAIKLAVLPKTGLDKGAQNAAVAGLGYIGIFLAALFAITSAGIDLSALAIVAGALSVGIGFGMQNIVSNFVSGIILLIERPISVGDWIEAGGNMGVVSDISVRSTRIRTFDQTDVIVPNSDLISQSVVNWTRGNLRGRIIVPISVGYGSDTRQVQKILLEIAEDQPTVLVDPGPVVLLTGFGADGLNFELRAILSDINGGMGVASEIRHEIMRRFREADIEVPFAQRDIWLRNPEVLHDAERATRRSAGPMHGVSTIEAELSGEGGKLPLKRDDKLDTAPANEPDTGDSDADAGVEDSPR